MHPVKGWLKKVSTVLLLLAGSLLTACDFVESSGTEVRAEVTEAPTASLESLRARHNALKRQLAQLSPTGNYIVVDTAHNRLYVKRRQETILTALASTGTGTILDKPNQPGAHWVFDTPRGEFIIQSKLTNPVWVKPDWAFLEEGLAIPTDPAERVESGILGDYALGFGKGYFIHGTLYTRLLGKNVTHGCIRLNDEDLRTVYRFAKIGTPLMIF
ncbi:MAG: L,D-transpeptidase [Nitrospiraceae bacterium]